MTEVADQMEPDASPSEVSKKAGVRRVNNMPMYLIGGLLGSFLLIMMWVAMDRAAKQHEPTKGPKEKAGSTEMFAKDIAGKYSDGLVAPTTAPVVPNLEASSETPVLIARPENLDAPPVPPGGGGGGNLHQPERDDEAERIRMAKLQMLEEAIKSKTGVPFVAKRSSGATPDGVGETPQTRDEMLARLAAVRQQINSVQRDDPTEAYQARLAQIRNMTGGAVGGGGIPNSSSAPTLLQTSGGAHNSGEIGDRWKLGTKPEAPRSPYEIRAGFVIPATMISGINSDLPGQINAQVSQNVYDTPTGRHLLIPQGSRLVGSYSSEVAYGQSRVLISWQRIVFPDGKAMDIGSMPGADSAGYSGFKDRVNNHYLRIFGSAFLMSGVVAGINLSQDDDTTSTNDSQRASDALSEALGQQLGQVTAQMIEKNMNIAPTLEIRPGYRFNVVVTKDMTFSKPYRGFDYHTKHQGVKYETEEFSR